MFKAKLYLINKGNGREKRVSRSSLLNFHNTKSHLKVTITCINLFISMVDFMHFLTRNTNSIEVDDACHTSLMSKSDETALRDLFKL